MRDDLKRRANVNALEHLSASSIKHTVSHLGAFFDWLLLQDGFRRLPKDFAGYLKLSKAVLAASPRVKHKEFPNLSEAVELLKGMPSATLVEQRACAIFAIGFLGALRADTLVSLQIRHFDISNRLILQNAKDVRAKGGKSLDIFWFPIQAVFEETVINWVQTLRRLGFGEEDALFPDTKFLKFRLGLATANKGVVLVMSTIHAVTDAFAVACRDNDIKFTPHAVKHTMGAERDARPLTMAERKAWSLNMGHENEQTTEFYYANMTDERRIEVLENIGTNDPVDLRKLPDSTKLALVDEILEKFADYI
jgi:integrase